MSADPGALRALFNPRTVAVVGASPDLGKHGGRCLDFLRRHGFRGAIYPVNGRYEEIGGLKCWPTLASIGSTVDLTIVMVPATAVAASLQDAADAGVRAAIVCSSGFAEAGEVGRQLEAELVRVARRTGIAVLGPNSSGLLNLHCGLTATFSTALQAVGPLNVGPISLVSQSGAVGAIVFAMAQAERIGLAHFVSSGNEAVLDFVDLFEHFVDDPSVHVILCYIEGLKRGRRFVELARRARDAGKVVAAIKVGTSTEGKRAAQSHTGSLAGSEQAYAAAFRRGGVLPVKDMRTLLDVAIALRAPHGGPCARIGLVTSSGGAGVMMADQCQTSGLALARFSAETRAALANLLPGFSSMGNPVDFGAIYLNLDAVLGCVEQVAADTEVDLVIFFVGLSSSLEGRLEPGLAAIQQRTGKPLLVAWQGGPASGVERLRGLGVAAYEDVTRVVEAARYLRLAATAIPSTPVTPANARSEHCGGTQAALSSVTAAGRTLMTEREVKALLGRYGIPVTQEIFVSDSDAAIAAARAMGRPVAVKAEAPLLLHKSDASAVWLHVLPADAGVAYDAVVAAAAGAVGAAAVLGAVIQPMAQPGLEILAGLQYDPQFGPTITVAMGGVTSEVLADAVTELAPLDHTLALSMLRRLRGAPLLESFRGAPARDVTALADVLVNLSRFAMDAGALVAELDLNPVIVHEAGKGCTVVDAAAVLATAAA